MEKDTEYSEVVTSIVDNNSYFKDAMDWYCIKYLNIKSERTFFILLSVISSIIIIFIYSTIKSLLPLKESFPVIILQEDSLNYKTTIKPLKPDGLNYTSNEAILRFLLIRYVRELFTHNYMTGNIDDITKKELNIKNYSTDEVYKKFRNDLNIISSEIFNKNISKNVIIKSFKFINLKNSKKNYFFKKNQTEALITYTIIITTPSDITNYDEKILLSFKFDNIKYNSIQKQFTKPRLIITNYRVIK